jgi:phospholipase D-like protein
MDDDAQSMIEAGAADESRRKKQWSDFSPQQQRAIILGAIAELVMTTIALRDLARRPADQIRGRKVVWLLTFVVQPFGPVLYFLVGRRRPR